MNSLENVKVGDKLLIQSRWNRRLATVDRLTPTLVIAGGERFKKASGNSVGHSEHYIWATLATDEDVEDVRREIRRNRMIRQCEDIRFHDLADSQLEQILGIANKKV